jgi:pimeloyl-ACP methyl ester carboxylesterase
MLSYRIVGEGPPLLLIHGWGVTWSVWHNLEPLLSQHARLIMVELPGMGLSPPPTQAYLSACVEALVMLREALGITRWTVLSYSASAGIGANYIRHDTAHISGAIFLCPILPLGIWPALNVIAHTVDRRWTALITWVFSGWRLRVMIGSLAFNQLRHRYVEDWLQEISAQPMPLLKTHLRVVFDPDWEHLPPAIPIIRIWGGDDRLAAWPRRMQPNDRIVAASHGAPLLSAPAVAQEVLAFLQAYPQPGRFDLVAGSNVQDGVATPSARAGPHGAAD